MSTVDRDHRHVRGHRLHGLPPPAGHRRTRVVTAEHPQPDGVRQPARRPGPALEGDGHQVLPLHADRVAGRLLGQLKGSIMMRVKAALAILTTGLVVATVGYALPASATASFPNVVVPV